MKAFLNSINLNGHTLGFHLQTYKVRTILCSIINSTTWRYCSIAFIWMASHSVSSTDLKVRTTVDINNTCTTRTNCSEALIFNCQLWSLKVWSTSCNVVNSMKAAMLNSLHLNGQTRTNYVSIHFFPWVFTLETHWLRFWTGSGKWKAQC